MMQSPATQWDEIFQRDGRIFIEPVPVVVYFTKLLKIRGYSGILDLGCGSGRHIVHMAQTNLEVYGLDSSPAALHLAAEWLAESGPNFSVDPG